MDRISFSVNGKACSVGSEVDTDVTLVDYLRNYQELRGTKYMCREGGCGACIVTVTAPDTLTGNLKTFSVNSCLILVAQCQDWAITTVEGIGDRLNGYHPVQRALAENNGTQCGYCSVGWVMSMYSLLESKHYDLTQYEIEDSFGSNTCRCTGYRPILEAFKSFAKDAPKPKSLDDIEDLGICDKKSGCSNKCDKSEWCFLDKDELEAKLIKKVVLKDGRVWYRVTTVQEIFDVLNKEGYESYMLVGGNTGRGAYHILEFPKVLIDISNIRQLKKHYLDQNLVIGAETTLTDLLKLLKEISKEKEEFKYLYKLYEHINLVAHIPVRNVGSIAGNLMVKHRVPTFSSDIFLLLEAVSAMLKIVDKNGHEQLVLPSHFLTMDMTGKVIVEIILPPYSEKYKFVSFKVLPRAQNAHAQVNAAFLYRFDHDQKTVLSANIVIGGLSAEFIHAKTTERYLVGKNLFSNEVLQIALHALDNELIVTELAGEMKATYRRKAALGLFYKGCLSVIPPFLLNSRFVSGTIDLRKSRPLSSAKDVYDTNPLVWPITEPMPKVEALIQCAGEAKYVNDLPKQPQEVFAAFVTSDVGLGEIENINPKPALCIPGVIAFYSAKDIPGINTFTSTKCPFIMADEELLSAGSIKFYDQPIGIIVAENENLARRAALLVQVTYKTANKEPILTIEDAKIRDPSRISVYMIIPARARGDNVQKVIKNTVNIFGQYHFAMEPYSCIARPTEDGIELISSSQWLDETQVAASAALNLNQNRINVVLDRCGGSFGARITRSLQVSTACALVTYLLNKPCRFIFDIQANLRIPGKRFSSTCDFEVAVSSLGEIQYLEYQLHEDNGYIYNEQIIIFAVAAIRNCYDNRRWSEKLYNVLTDKASNSWCRSPGTFEAIAMTEYIMEQISYELDLDPLQVRLTNINNSDEIIKEIINTLARDGDYSKRREEVKQFNKENRWLKRGLRVALMSWSSVISADNQVLLSVFHGDGTVVLKHGGVEMGQGINTRVIQAVAFTLNLPLDKIKIKLNDSTSNPNTFATGGSNTTENVTFGAIKCCQLLLERLQPVKVLLNNPTWGELIQAAYNRGISLQTNYHTTSNDINVYRIAGAALAEVQLDVLTGEYWVRRVDIVQDAGTSINPELDVGQIEGGFIMGMGYWTSEHLIYDKKTGELQTDRTWNYKVPLAKDIPIDFRIQLRRNSFNPLGVLGTRSISEAPTCLAVCVAFALHEAISESRRDSGFPKTQWFNVDGPYTLEANVLSADVKVEEFLYS